MSDVAQGNAPIIYRRETLYHEVWAEPLKRVARRYGVSDVALGKICRKLAIPLPGRGYWAKHRAGRAPARPPLGELPPGVRDEIQVPRWSRQQAGVRLTTPEENSKRPAIEVVVPERLARPHPLVREARELLRGPGPRKALVSCRDKACLDIEVSRGSLGRTLRIADALVKALEEQGYVVEVTEPSHKVNYYGSSSLVPGVTRVLVGEDWIDFALSEKCTSEKRTITSDWGYVSTHWVGVPNGALSLSITNSPGGLRRSWNDGKKQRLEDCLVQFIEYLPLVSERLKEKRLEAERKHQEWLEREQRRQEEEARQLAEQARQKELLSAVERWRLARDIRSFLAEAERALSKQMLEDEEPSGAVRERLLWAQEYVQQLDPISEYVSVKADEPS